MSSENKEPINLKAEKRLDANGKPVRALGLCSGGLDSLLALAVVRAQGVEVLALTFTSPFLTAERAEQGCLALGIAHRRVDFSADHIGAVKNPRYGLGSNMNPCLDCHALMIRSACRIAEEEGYHFVFTGEVLGQRPMSQNRQSLHTVAKYSGGADKLVRPLSALVMQPSRAEEQGWLDRERLYGINGRGRKEQIALAEQYGVRDYPTPAGGCPLTDPGFSRRLKHLLELDPESGARMMELLNWGRHFDLGGGVRVIIGRDEAENLALEERVRPGDYTLDWTGGTGPLGLMPLADIAARPSSGQLETAAEILLAYTRAKEGKWQVEIKGPQDKKLEVEVKPKTDYKGMMVN